MRDAALDAAAAEAYDQDDQGQDEEPGPIETGAAKNPRQFRHLPQGSFIASTSYVRDSRLDTAAAVPSVTCICCLEYHVVTLREEGPI